MYGIPFAFIPSDKTPPEARPRPPAIEVASVEGREHLRIAFPKLDGYRVEIPDEQLLFDADDAEPFVIGRSTVPTWVESAGVVGASERVESARKGSRRQEVAFRLAARMLDTHYSTDAGDRRPWLFPRLVHICRDWIDQCVVVEDGFDVGYLLDHSEQQAGAVDAVWHAIVTIEGDRRPRLRPMLRRFDPIGSTAEVSFLTRKAVHPTMRSEVSHVTLDGIGGNTWEQLFADECELNSDVGAYVKNDHLGFAIPYVHQGSSHSYIPDFLIRLKERPGDDLVRTLIVEVSGGQKSHTSPGPTKVKALTARDSWCAAVNNWGELGRWGYIEITTMAGVRETLAGAIQAMYDEAPIIGDPDLLDFEEVARGA